MHCAAPAAVRGVSTSSRRTSQVPLWAVGEGAKRGNSGVQAGAGPPQGLRRGKPTQSSTRCPMAPVATQAHAGFGIPQVACPAAWSVLAYSQRWLSIWAGFGADAGDLGKGLGQLGLPRAWGRPADAPATRPRWPVPSSAQRRAPGLLDSRVSQAMRWWVLRAAFHCGPSADRPGCMACGNASISVQQGDTLTPAGFFQQRRGFGCVCAAGPGPGLTELPAPRRRSRDHTHAMLSASPVVRNCHWSLFSVSRSMRVTRVLSSGSGRPPEAVPSAGSVHSCRARPPSGVRARAGRRQPHDHVHPAPARCWRSMPCTALGVVCRACTKRGSRTVKYCAPVVKGAKRAVARGHAPAHGVAFLENRHAVPRLHQCAGTGDSRHACSNDGDVSGSGHTGYLQELM
jgi:hypothetical protein